MNIIYFLVLRVTPTIIISSNFTNNNIKYFLFVYTHVYIIDFHYMAIGFNVDISGFVF